MSENAYQGTELALFDKAVIWQSYLKGFLEPQLRGSVLEVGAGKGSTTASLLALGPSRWTCLEPDAALAREISARNLHLPNGEAVLVRAGGSSALAASERFDSILYVNVLEHIGDDKAELARACSHLAPGGRLCVLAPAHQFLFSPFDSAIGHFRRYNRPMLLGAAPAGMKLLELRYLDSVGLLASLVNRLFLRQAQPSPGQIAFWDGVLVRASRIADPLTGYQLGKSLLGVWEA